MSQPFIGEIRMAGFSFAPANWAFCNGQTLAIAQNQALFSLLGTTYGGDGQTTFNLPNLQSRVAIHQGFLTNGSSYVVGETGGAETVALTLSTMPAHSHALYANSALGDAPTPAGNYFAASNEDPFASSGGSATGTVLAPVGGNQPHSNIQPYLAINFIIALFGIYPSRS